MSAAVPSPQAARLNVESAASLTSNCGPARSIDSVAAGFPGCPFDDTGLGMTVSARQDADFGVIDTHGFFGRSHEGALAPWRQLSSGNPGGISEESTLALIGIKASLLDGRLKLSSTFGWSERWIAPIFQSPLAQWRRDTQGASASQQKLELDVVNRPGLHWSVTGEVSRAGETFAYGQSMMLYRGSYMAPGRRYALSTALKLKQWRLSAFASDYSASFGASQARRIGISNSGVSVTVSTRRSEVAPSMLAGGISSRTRGTSLYAEVDTAGLFPALAFERRGWRVLVPTLLTFNLANSRTDAAYPDYSSRFGRKSMELYGTWETPLGETTLGYSRDTKRGLAGSVRDTSDRTVQASHTVRRGGWRLGVDGVVMESTSPGGSGFGDRSLSIGQTLAYSRTGGPEFMLRIGNDRVRSQARDGTYDSAHKASRITATLDMTNYLRRRLERQDIALKLDYRRRLDNETYSYTSFDDVLERFTENEGHQGLLLSFNMQLR